MKELLHSMPQGFLQIQLLAAESRREDKLTATLESAARKLAGKAPREPHGRSLLPS